MAKIFKHGSDIPYFDYKDFKRLQRFQNFAAVCGSVWTDRVT